MMIFNSLFGRCIHRSPKISKIKKKIAKIKTSKEHLTSEGFEKILKIKSGMNSLRF